MKQHTLFPLLVIWLSSLAPTAFAQTAQTAFRSFIATMTTTTYSADFPTLSLTVSEDVAVRSDGSSVRVQYPLGPGRMVGNTPATWRGVFDFSTGRLTVVHHRDKSDGYDEARCDSIRRAIPASVHLSWKRSGSDSRIRCGAESADGSLKSIPWPRAESDDHENLDGSCSWLLRTAPRTTHREAYIEWLGDGQISGETGSAGGLWTGG